VRFARVCGDRVVARRPDGVWEVDIPNLEAAPGYIAVFGDEIEVLFSEPALLSAVAARSDEEVLSGLEPACGARLLIDLGQTYQFTHDVVRRSWKRTSAHPFSNAARHTWTNCTSSKCLTTCSTTQSSSVLTAGILTCRLK
jgi:hypothetical protein